MDPVIHWILRGGLAVLMGTAAFHKASAPAVFTGTLRDYRILPELLAPPVALCIALAEAVVAVALLAPGPAPGAAMACAALLLVYSAAIGVNLARGRRHIDCGCFGPRARQPLHGGLLFRNFALLTGCGLAALPTISRPTTWLDTFSIAAGMVVAGLLFLAIPAVLANAARLRSTP